MMFCCSADGKMLPPMTAYKSQSGYCYDTWAEGHPVGSVITANKSGWFGMAEYETWFNKVFLKYLDANIPKVPVPLPMNNVPVPTVLVPYF